MLRTIKRFFWCLRYAAYMSRYSEAPFKWCFKKGMSLVTWEKYHPIDAAFGDMYRWYDKRELQK